MNPPLAPHRLVGLATLVTLLAALLCGAAWDEPKVSILTASQVYYPVPVKKHGKYKKPATLTTSTVFATIKEWQEIKKRGLTESDAEYHLLLKKANQKFDNALQTVRRGGSYDIIAEQGAISCENCTATDVTQDIVNALP